uniref:Uncharacterized protein n=1 Tax=viral metagenome TaxID=1070528 RepID=A0A6H2A487_9ZZZZ
MNVELSPGEAVKACEVCRKVFILKPRSVRRFCDACLLARIGQHEVAKKNKERGGENEPKGKRGATKGV